MLKKDFVPDGKGRIIGSVTTGYSNPSSIVRDERNQIAGRTNERFQTTRDARGNLLPISSFDPALVIGNK